MFHKNIETKKFKSILSFNTFTIHLMTLKLFGHLKKDTTGMEFVPKPTGNPNFFVM